MTPGGGGGSKREHNSPQCRGRDVAMRECSLNSNGEEETRGGAEVTGVLEVEG